MFKIEIDQEVHLELKISHKIPQFSQKAVFE